MNNDKSMADSFMAIKGVDDMLDNEKSILDEDGENQAVRCFLMMYGNQSVTVDSMKRHLKLCGYPLWPKLVDDEESNGHLTKSVAQHWIRYLFSLEPESGLGNP